MGPALRPVNLGLHRTRGTPNTLRTRTPSAFTSSRRLSAIALSACLLAAWRPFPARPQARGGVRQNLAAARISGEHVSKSAALTFIW
jgi:hypothetical protein